VEADESRRAGNQCRRVHCLDGLIGRQTIPRVKGSCRLSELLPWQDHSLLARPKGAGIDPQIARLISAAPVISTFRSPIFAAELRKRRANYCDQERPNATVWA